MPVRMTITVDDEEVFAALKAAAIKDGCAPKDIVISAIRELLESQEDEVLETELRESRAEWIRDGGIDAEALLVGIDVITEN